MEKITAESAKWTRNLQGMPSFSHELLKEHLLLDTSGKKGKQPNAQKHKKHGYQLFKDKMVSKVQVMDQEHTKLFVFKCNVHASMKKTHYSVYAHLHKDTGKVEQASCSCVAGQGGLCKHVAALLFQILDFIQLELKEVPDDLTCTQLLQQWHVPRNEEIKAAVLFDSIKFAKATSKQKDSHNIEVINPAPAFSKVATQVDMAKLYNGLEGLGACSYLQGLLQSNHYKPFDHQEFLKKMPSKKKICEANQNANQLFEADVRDTILNNLESPKFVNIQKCIPSQEHVEFVRNRLFKNKQEIKRIECDTRGQSSNNLWFEEKKLRLTASNFGMVLKRRETIYPKAILTKQFSSCKLKSTPRPCLWGQTNEQTAISKYLENCREEGKLVKACVQCGLIVNTEAPWLGASPDCLLYDPSESKPYGIGEVKCPFSKRDVTIDNACGDSSFFLENKQKPTLRRNHNYYYQVQGLMATCNVEWADFIVYTSEDLFTERIYLDQNLWKTTMLPKLTSFYFSYIYPELIKK